MGPVHTNRASDLGFPCDRNAYYWRTVHEQAALPTIALQEILEFGTDYEEMLRRRLMAAGYKLRQEQVTRHWRDPNITGHPEGWISEDDGQTWELIEIKGLHPNFFDRVHRWQDFLGMGPIYARYPAQGQIYMLLENVARMTFLIGKKGSYAVKWLPMALDYEYAESLITKAERINRMVDNGPIPARVTDPEVCQVCPFKLHCLPDQDYGPGAELLDDGELLTLLRRRDDLAPLSKEYAAVDTRVKARVKDKPLVLIGEYEIRGEPQSRRAYEVKPTTFWVTKILNRTSAPSVVA